MRTTPVARFLKDNGITWTHRDPGGEGLAARIDIAKDGTYIGSVNGLGNTQKVAQLVFSGENLNAAILAIGGWYAR